MPTDRFACLVGGAGLLLIFLSMPGQWAAHFIGLGLATALLWRGTAGRARVAVVAAVIAAAALGWLHHRLAPGQGADLADFIAGAAAALAVSAALFIRGKYLCAESSEP
jgi:VanZ family protein